MHTFKVLSMAVLISTVLMSDSNSSETNEISSIDISMEFRDNGKYLIKCDGNEHLFKDTKSFSKLSSNIFGEYFKFDSILNARGIENTIVFRNFNTTDKCFSLSLIYNSPAVLNTLRFDCMDNNVKFPVIDNLENINGVKIYSDSPNNVSFPVNNVSSDILDKCYLNNESMWLSDRLDMK